MPDISGLFRWHVKRGIRDDIRTISQVVRIMVDTARIHNRHQNGRMPSNADLSANVAVRKSEHRFSVTPPCQLRGAIK